MKVCNKCCYVWTGQKKCPMCNGLTGDSVWGLRKPAVPLHRRCTITDFLLIGVIVASLLYLAYEAMNRDLCARHLSPVQYQEMKLDCSIYAVPSHSQGDSNEHR